MNVRKDKRGNGLTRALKLSLPVLGMAMGGDWASDGLAEFFHQGGRAPAGTSFAW